MPLIHYCGHPDRRAEPTLCGLSRELDAPEDPATTTRGWDATCPECLKILEG